MKLFVTFTIIGALAGFFLADHCDDVNHENLPGGRARKDDFQSKADFKEELKNYRKLSCEKFQNCDWSEQSGGVCEKRFVSQNAPHFKHMEEKGRKEKQ